MTPVLGEATIVVKLDPDSLATVERLERLADRLEALIPATEGAPAVDSTISHDPYAPEGAQPADGAPAAPEAAPGAAVTEPVAAATPEETAGTEPQDAPDPSPAADPAGPTEPAAEPVPQASGDAEPAPTEEAPDVPES